MKDINIVIVGVGGQGTLLASKIIGRLAIAEKQEVKVSEVHGMSQRGGSVITHVRIGKAVASPIVAEGTADYLLSFELLEAARAIPFLNETGTVIVNTQQILPMPVITGTAAYPENLLNCFGSHKVEAADALSVAEKCGSQKAVNLVLLGILSMHLPFPPDSWKTAIGASVPRKTLETNLKAFECGRSLIEERV